MADAGDVLDTSASGTLTTTGDDAAGRGRLGRRAGAARRRETPYASSLGGRRVAVPSSDRGSTRVVELDGGAVATVPGEATLSDDGSQLVSLRTTRDDRASVWLGTPASQQRLEGLPATLTAVRWLDGDTVVATDARTLWSCETTTRVCGRLPVAPDDRHRLGIGR